MIKPVTVDGFLILIGRIILFKFLANPLKGDEGKRSLVFIWL